MGDAIGGVPVRKWCVAAQPAPMCHTHPLPALLSLPCQARLLLLHLGSAVRSSPITSAHLCPLPPPPPPSSPSPAGAAFLLWELSTPLVHLRWVLSQAGAGSTRLYLANGLAMVVVFFACRPAWGTYMSYRVRGGWAREGTGGKGRGGR